MQKVSAPGAKDPGADNCDIVLRSLHDPLDDGCRCLQERDYNQCDSENPVKFMRDNVIAASETQMSNNDRNMISRDISLMLASREPAVNHASLWARLLAIVLDEESDSNEATLVAAELGRSHAQADAGIESLIRGYAIVRDSLELRLGQLSSYDEYRSQVRERLDCALAAAVSELTATLVTNARCDRVTGLANRAAFELALTEEIERAKRYQTSFTLVMFDVDDFKGVNDRLGHIEGDRVLRAVASTIVATLRRSDRVFRFGGDEFVAICLGDAGGGIARAIGRIEQAMTEVGISSGAAVFPDDAREATELIRIADERMFERKRNNGKNGKERK